MIQTHLSGAETAGLVAFPSVRAPRETQVPEAATRISRAPIRIKALAQGRACAARVVTSTRLGSRYSRDMLPLACDGAHSPPCLFLAAADHARARAKI